MIVVKLFSNLYKKNDLSGEYEVEAATSIVDFLARFDIDWDTEALIVVNDVIIEKTYLIQDGDHIHLLTPIYGG